MIKRINIFAIIAISLLAACTKDIVVNVNTTHRFFDIADYFKTEIARMNAQKSKAIKVASVDSNSETHTFDSLDMTQELEVFLHSDINRPAWTDKYQADTMYDMQGKLLQLSYKALKNNLKTRLIEVYFDSTTQVQKIYISNISKNLFSDIEQRLSYQPNVGYKIESTQDLLFFPKSEVRVNVDFK